MRFFVTAFLALTSLAIAKLSGSLSPDAIAKRLTPMAVVNVTGVQAVTAPASSSGGAMTPEQIFADNCKMCHGTGVAGAPVFGNKADWAPRIAQGMDTLCKPP